MFHRLAVSGVLFLFGLVPFVPVGGAAGTPQLAGTGDEWYLVFGYKNTTFFLNAQYAPSNADPSNPTGFTFGYGHVAKSPSGGALYANDGTALGKVDTAKGLIYITTTYTNIGPKASPAAPPVVLKTVLDHVGGQTYEEVGAAGTGSLQPADSAGSGLAYAVGHNC
jgi:hypothetical protein